MKYKRRGSNQYQKKTNTHYVLWYLIFIAIVVSLGMFAKSKKPAYAQILSPLASPSASLTVEGKEKALPQPEVTTPVEEESIQIEKYIKTIFGRDAKVAIAISHHECNPANKMYPKCNLHTHVENSVGIFQINIESATAKVHWARIPGETLEEKKTWLENPYNNTLLAFWIFQTSGWTPWSAYTSGRYLADM